MKLLTPVQDGPCTCPISYDEKIMFIGSCFSDNVGKILSDYGFDVLVNPFGTLYNPASIRESLLRLSECRPFVESDCIRMGSGSEMVCSFNHHTSFARKTPEEFLENANASLRSACGFFKGCDTVIVTLGTAWCFIREGRTVSNCLKRDAREFVRERLSLERCTALLSEITSLCASAPKPKKVIFTVSPIRHLADGANGNQLSKSTLLLAIDNVINAVTAGGHSGTAGSSLVSYFPAYEIMMDELRDYRFYADDLTHPSSLATSYIAERFLAWALPSKEHPLLESRIKEHKRASHRPRE